MEKCSYKKSLVPGAFCFHFGPLGSNIRLRPTWARLLYFLIPSLPFQIALPLINVASFSFTLSKCPSLGQRALVDG